MVQEHKCVLDSCRSLEMEGFHVTYLPVQSNGVIDLKVSTHLVLTLCGHTRQKTNQGGLGLSGSVHEEARPCFPSSV